MKIVKGPLSIFKFFIPVPALLIWLKGSQIRDSNLNDFFHNFLVGVAHNLELPMNCPNMPVAWSVSVGLDSVCGGWLILTSVLGDCSLLVTLVYGTADGFKVKGLKNYTKDYEYFVEEGDKNFTAASI
jgi:hypothetical protein